MAGAQTTSKRDGSRRAPFFMKKGRTFSLNVTVTSEGKPVNLSSPARTGRADLRASGNQHSVAAVADATMSVAITDATRGKAVVSLGATITETLSPGLYVSDVEFEDTGTPNPDDVIGSDLFYVEVGEEATK